MVSTGMIEVQEASRLGNAALTNVAKHKRQRYRSSAHRFRKRALRAGDGSGRPAVRRVGSAAGGSRSLELRRLTFSPWLS